MAWHQKFLALGLQTQYCWKHCWPHVGTIGFELPDHSGKFGAYPMQANRCTLSSSFQGLGNKMENDSELKDYVVHSNHIIGHLLTYLEWWTIHMWQYQHVWNPGSQCVGWCHLNMGLIHRKLSTQPPAPCDSCAYCHLALKQHFDQWRT